nr:MAG TPA: hypothetical protein [Bacteriophage sp.]
MFVEIRRPRRWPPLFMVMTTPALREDRGFPPYSKGMRIVFFTIFAQGRCPRGSYSLFLQTYRHSFHRFFKV